MNSSSFVFSGGRQYWLLIAGIAFAAFMVKLDMYIVNITSNNKQVMGLAPPEKKAGISAVFSPLFIITALL